jgi:hypothetical protein
VFLGHSYWALSSVGPRTAQLSVGEERSAKGSRAGRREVAARVSTLALDARRSFCAPDLAVLDGLDELREC